MTNSLTDQPIADRAGVSPMGLNEYQRLAQRTVNHDLSARDRLLTAVLGLGEAGEVQGVVKKWLGHGHPMDRDKIIDELGDVLWYIQENAAILGVSLEEVAARNIAKLRKRYPQGFSAEASLHRAEDDV
jgi:NTP pyrophosphatase (non-canonical NTP hydrolase)